MSRSTRRPWYFIEGHSRHGSDAYDKALANRMLRHLAHLAVNYGDPDAAPRSLRDVSDRWDWKGGRSLAACDCHRLVTYRLNYRSWREGEVCWYCEHPWHYNRK